MTHAVTRLASTLARIRLAPRFLRTQYSPYQCRVSANRENYDVRARVVHLQNLIKTWVETGRNPFRAPVECRHCLFDTRIPNIYIGADGLCNMCRTYRANFKSEVLASEVEAFLTTPREPGSDVDAVVAFSGGKDSAVALLLARRQLNLRVGLALNPETPVSSVSRLIDGIDSVLFLTVHPGYYGSRFLPEVLPKINELRRIAPAIEVGVDGGIKEGNISRIARLGVDTIYVGSAIFNEPAPDQAYRRLRSLIQDA